MMQLVQREGRKLHLVPACEVSCSRCTIPNLETARAGPMGWPVKQRARERAAHLPNGGSAFGVSISVPCHPRPCDAHDLRHCLALHQRYHTLGSSLACFHSLCQMRWSVLPAAAHGAGEYDTLTCSIAIPARRT